MDGRTDVFGLGGVLFEILTGAAPNEGKAVLATARGENKLNFTPRALLERLPPELCRIAGKAPAAKPDARYQSVAALREDLERFLKGGGWFDTLTAAAGDTIVRKGDSGSSAYIIQSGSCDVWKNFAEEARLIRRLGPGDVFVKRWCSPGGCARLRSWLPSRRR